MTIKTITTFNPFSKQFQKTLDPSTIAEKEHKHSINEVNGLQTILSDLNNGNNINLQGGYFIN